MNEKKINENKKMNELKKISEMKKKNNDEKFVELKKKIAEIKISIDKLNDMTDAIYGIKGEITKKFHEWFNTSQNKKFMTLTHFQEKINNEIARLQALEIIFFERTGLNTKDYVINFYNSKALEEKWKKNYEELKLKINKKIINSASKLESTTNQNLNKLKNTELDKLTGIKPDLEKKFNEIINNLGNDICNKVYDEDSINYFMYGICKVNTITRYVFEMNKYLFLVFLIGIQFLPIYGQLALGFVVIVNGKRWQMQYEKNKKKRNNKK